MKDDRFIQDYLRDILDASEKAQRFVTGMTIDEFKKDDKTQFAVIRAIEIIGEAAKKIPKHIQGNYSEIPWREIAGMRDKMIHEYSGVDTVVVWKTITEDIPSLIPSIKQMLRDFE